MEIKTYNIADYPRQCPHARAVEDAVNNCGTPTSNLEKIKSIFGYDDRLYCFFCACLQYWAQTERYDERNRTAILISREIIRKFPKIPQFKGVEICDEILREAYAFTHFAHRYLQNELFKVILHYLKETGHNGIHEWYQKQEFVIDTFLEKATPWKEYRKTH